VSRRWLAVLPAPGGLIAARAAQGFGGALVSAVSLSLIVSLFVEEPERAKAMGFFGFVAAGGGALGVLLGGVLTDLLDWHWVFLVNIPLGIAVSALSLRLLPAAEGVGERKRLDVAGATLVTAALLLAVYATVNGNTAGWLFGQTLGLLAAAAAVLAAFFAVEARTSAPLVPLAILRRRNLVIPNVVGVLWAAPMFAWFFLTALYLQLVLGYSPLDVGLAFLPANVIMAVFSLGFSARMVMRFGIKLPITAGLTLAAAGLVLLARAPADGDMLDVLPSMILLGIGAGMALNPVLLAATGEVEQSDAGLASGIVNTSFMMGGALGLAVLASVASSRTEALITAGETHAGALVGGYHAAFVVGAGFAALAALLTARLMREPSAVADAETIRAEATDGELDLRPGAHQFVSYAAPCDVCPDDRPAGSRTSAASA
jgi:MFS family permease